jgi:drug/metabolite transporter (DMT)-like permease
MGSPDAHAPIQPGTAEWASLLTLTLVWGTAFLAINVAVETLPPLTLVAIRVSVAALLLCVVVFAVGLRLPPAGSLWLRFLLLAFVGNALPFTAISWGQQRIDSGLAGVMMAVMPLTTLVLAHFFVAGERMTKRRTAGFALGLGGIIVLTGPSVLAGLGGEPSEIIRQLAVLSGALCYAVNTILAQRMPATHPVVASACTMLMASLLMLPTAALVDRPWELSPSGTSLQSAIWLGLAATGAATVLYFRIVTTAGPTFLSLMNYIIPVIAMLTGIAFAGEPFEWRSVGALALILTGLVVATRTAPAPMPPSPPSPWPSKGSPG